MVARTLGWSKFFSLIVGVYALCSLTLSAQAQTTASVARAYDAKSVAVAPVHPAAPSAKARTEEHGANQGMNTGIKVHGHWVIEVKNPDGKLVTRREFENSLIPGQTFLANFLSRQQTVGAWSIWLSSSNSAKSACTVNGGGPILCEIDEPNSAEASNCQSGPTGCFATLQVIPPSSNGATFSLSGSAVAQVSGVIDTVQTFQASCNSATLPSACASAPAPNTSEGVSGQFSGTTLPAQGSGQCGGANQPSCLLNVQPQQIINVTVTYSFQ